jgi:hypothetical protein
VLLAPQHFSQGLVDADSAVVANESLFPESVHEDIDSRAGSADHLRQNLVIYSDVSIGWRGALRLPECRTG